MTLAPRLRSLLSDLAVSRKGVAVDNLDPEVPMAAVRFTVPVYEMPGFIPPRAVLGNTEAATIFYERKQGVLGFRSQEGLRGGKPRKETQPSKPEIPTSNSSMLVPRTTHGQSNTSNQHSS